MKLEKTNVGRRHWRLALALALPTYFISVVVAALLLSPAESFAVTPCPKAATHDFDNDCKSDILWRNSTSEQGYVWLMNGAGIASQGVPGSAVADWGIQGIGDFDGDGKADVLWRNITTGQVYLWFMNGTAIGSQSVAPSATSDWTIQGVGDFDNDGKADILWRNSTSGQVYIWLMNGASIAGSGIPGGATSDWVIQGVGDFDGDGKSDILWRNTTTGQVYIWFMNGAAIKGQGAAPSATLDWAIQGVGDFDGNGMADILWRNSTTGQTYIWLMNGTAIASSASPGSAAADWDIQGVGDYDGDGKSDILWQNTFSGQTYIWFMNGAAISSQAAGPSATPDWQLTLISPYVCPTNAVCNIVSGINNVRANGSFGPGNPTPSSTAGGPLAPLAWSVGAATVAQGYAAQCNFAHNPNRGDYGENIYAAGGTSSPVPITGSDAASDWANEAANYTYSTNACAAGQTCGHYTQIVWRNTTMVGCAIQQCTTNSPFGASFPDWAFAVCDFAPPGNFTGQQPY